MDGAESNISTTQEVPVGYVSMLENTHGGAGMIYSEEGLEEEQMSELDCESVSDLIAEVERLREQYTELREALVGDSPNWTHEEVIEKALELIDND